MSSSPPAKRPRDSDPQASSSDDGSILVKSDFDGGCVRFSERAAGRSEMLQAGLEMELDASFFSAPVSSASLELAAKLLSQDDASAEAEVAALSEAADVYALCRCGVFLGADSLQRAACRRVAALIEEFDSPSSVRAALDIVADLTAEEERAALDEPLFASSTTTPTSVPPPSCSTSTAELQVPSLASRSLSMELAGDRTSSADDVASAVLDHCTPAALWTLKGVSRAWQERARRCLASSTWRRELDTSADSLMGLTLDLDFALPPERERWDMIADLALTAPETAQLRVGGLLVDLDALGTDPTVTDSQIELCSKAAARGVEERCDEGECSLDDDGQCIFCGWRERPCFEAHPLPWAASCFMLARGTVVVWNVPSLLPPESTARAMAEALGRCAARCPSLRRACFCGRDIPAYLLRPPLRANEVPLLGLADGHNRNRTFPSAHLLFCAHVIAGAAVADGADGPSAQSGTVGPTLLHSGMWTDARPVAVAAPVAAPLPIPFELVLSRLPATPGARYGLILSEDDDRADGEIWARAVQLLTPVLRPDALPSLVRLYLNGARLGESGTAALATVLTSGALPNLLLLSLVECEMGDAGASNLAAAIAVGGLRRCTMLNLADNRLSDAGLLALIAAAAAGDALGQLTELTLGAFPYAAWHQDVCSASELGPYTPFEGRNEFSDEALEALAAAAGALPSLGCIHLGDANPGADALHAITNAAETRGFVVYGGRVSEVRWRSYSDGQVVTTRPEGLHGATRYPSAGFSAALLAGDEAAFKARPIDWMTSVLHRPGCACCGKSLTEFYGTSG